MANQKVADFLNVFDQQTKPVVALITLSKADEAALLPMLVERYSMAAYMHAMGNSSDISESIYNRLIHSTTDVLIIDFSFIDSRYLRGSMVDYTFRHFIDGNMLEQPKAKRIIITSYGTDFELGPVVNSHIHKVI